MPYIGLGNSVQLETKIKIHRQDDGLWIMSCLIGSWQSMPSRSKLTEVVAKPDEKLTPAWRLLAGVVYGLWLNDGPGFLIYGAVVMTTLFIFMLNEY